MPRQVWVRSLVPKLKNCGVLGDFVGDQAPRGNFDHGADHVFDLGLLLLLHLFGDAMDDFQLS